MRPPPTDQPRPNPRGTYKITTYAPVVVVADGIVEEEPGDQRRYVRGVAGDEDHRKTAPDVD